MKKQSVFSGLLALLLSLSLIAFKVLDKKEKPVAASTQHDVAEYYWYYVASDGYVYSYSLAFASRRTRSYAKEYGACGNGESVECMRGFVYPLTSFPDNSYGDEVIYKAYP
ncbi:hypothetical protein HHL16_22945 [Pseudoflavitalea sp. G-6-1-2]|uniref:hypothetical protein n=1 Tax=Pseudoflavitalea sp. G-6-1-2 TaxID=2728841 RepID=UPI00146D8DE1|nr:hypothetical protein [Pseudoflavitalea sp. G-6-1-2]NML23757.1 hypothetical protein [Pseudoflavitalea sp. G-6-1-2]